MAIREAVSAVFAFDGTIFMIRRQPYLTVFPGYHAFPGGKVDPEDRQEKPVHRRFSQFPATLIRALRRELMEELDVDLETLADQGAIADFYRCCEATTPPFHSHRFQTHFFRIDLTQALPLKADRGEAADYGWFSPADLLARFQRGALLAVPPNVSMFRSLAKDMAQKDLGDVNLKYDPETQVPCMEIFGNLWQLLVRSKTLPPAKFTNAFVIGGWLVDPSPESEAEMEKLLTSLKRFSLKGIFLTHHHADHHQFCPQIARRLKLPVGSSQDSYQRITRIRPDYFAGIETRTAKDGDVLTRWNDQDVKVHGVPGHDEGQLGLAPESMAWFLVGDLIQGVGTVVISAPEGHMGRYFQSLERVIQLDPGIIMPSHGLAMGTTYRLRATLKHRKKREAQIWDLLQRGLDEAAMLPQIYAGLDERLFPYAMANIRSHLQKLREEAVR